MSKRARGGFYARFWYTRFPLTQRDRLGLTIDARHENADPFIGLAHKIQKRLLAQRGVK